MSEKSAVPADSTEHNPASRLGMAVTATEFLAEPAGQAFTQWHDEAEQQALEALVERVIERTLDGSLRTAPDPEIDRWCMTIRLARTWREDYVPTMQAIVEHADIEDEETPSY